MLNHKSVLSKDLIEVNCEQNNIAQSVITIDENLNNGDNDIQDHDLNGKNFKYDEREVLYDDNLSSTNDENKENFETDDTEGSERSSSPLLVESKYQNVSLLEDSLGIKKKRGRPKKLTSTPTLPKRRVGRPKKYEIDIKIKGRVGRPRKVLPSNEDCENLHKTLPSVKHDQDSYKFSYNFFPNKTYSGRGRPPRGYVAPPKAPKRPRGRPRISARSTKSLDLVGPPVYSGRGRPPRGYVAPPKPPKRPRGRPRLSNHSRLTYSQRELSNYSDDEDEEYVDIENFDESNNDNDNIDFTSYSQSDEEYDPLMIKENEIHNNDNSTFFPYSNGIKHDIKDSHCYNSASSISDNSEIIDTNITLIYISKNLFRNKNLKRKRNGLPKIPKPQIKRKPSIYNTIVNTTIDFPVTDFYQPEKILKKRGRKSKTELLARMKHFEDTYKMSNEIGANNHYHTEELDTDDSQPTYLDLELDSQIYDNNTIYSCTHTQHNFDLIESIVISDSEDESIENHNLEPTLNLDPSVNVPVKRNDSQFNVISLVSEDSDSDSTSVNFEDDDEELLIPINNSNMRII